MDRGLSWQSSFSESDVFIGNTSMLTSIVRQKIFKQKIIFKAGNAKRWNLCWKICADRNRVEHIVYEPMSECCILMLGNSVFISENNEHTKIILTGSIYALHRHRTAETSQMRVLSDIYDYCECFSKYIILHFVDNFNTNLF